MTDMGKRAAGTRQQRLHAKALERRAFTSGKWGDWECTPTPSGMVGGSGWTREIRFVYSNGVYAVLERPMMTPWGFVRHLAIRTASNLEPPWRDKQRIKNELFGPFETAIEVMPPASEVVDQADMYHMWILPADMPLPFSLHDSRHERRGAS